MKSVEQKRLEAEERNQKFRSMPLHDRLQKALQASGGKRTRQVKKLEAEIDKAKKQLNQEAK